MNHIEEAQLGLQEINAITSEVQSGNEGQIKVLALYASMAQAHALIAIAEQLRELNRFDRFRYEAEGGAL